MSTNKMADTGSHMSKTSDNKLKYTTFIGSSNVQNSRLEECLSLQDAFKRYRKARQKDIKKARRLRKRWELRQGDPNKMAALRQKFVNQAKKYIGYPYARKYWPPNSPEYKSKLFLDCCGLVRQVMRDLAEDFGFMIGPWNQAYMYDTLPITVERERDMKPGDLVFISATYYNPKSKKQRHNMTHVEIWEGTGHKTIGSRWNNGKVQIWDSYKFTAKSYYDETYHFKSIDTWLMGICESHCSQHRWKKRIYNPGKKSVFAVQDDDNGSQDETAGDGDDNVTDQVLPSGSCQQLPADSNDMEMEDIKDETIATAMVDKSTSTTSGTEEPKKLEDLLTVKKAFTKDPEGSGNTIAQKFSSSVNICLKLPTFPLTPESCFIDKSNTEKLNDESVVEKSLEVGAAGTSLKGVASEPCLRTHADYLETKKAVIHECSTKVAGSIERDRVAVLDDISPDQMKTKIAWVPLGTCPVCQTDLDSMHASEPCHNPCASDNDGLVLEEVDDTSTSSRNSPSLSPGDAKVLESKAVSSANKKAKCDTADSNDVAVSNISNNALPKAVSSANKKAKSDSADSNDVAVSNISNNALPKPKKSSSNTSLADMSAKCGQSCEDCHDVQPSESYEEQEPQGEAIQVRQKTKKQSKVRNKAKTQSRSSSGSLPVSR